MKQPLTFQVTLSDAYEMAIEKTVAALKEEGFGVLTHLMCRLRSKKKATPIFAPTSFWVLATLPWLIRPPERLIAALQCHR
jgi:hypothetical protein